MDSLKTLVTKHGFGIKVKSVSDRNYPSFTIIKEDNSNFFRVQYDNGDEGSVFKECETTNDYILISK